jgi:hypothetical protein
MFELKIKTMYPLIKVNKDFDVTNRRVYVFFFKLTPWTIFSNLSFFIFSELKNKTYRLMQKLALKYIQELINNLQPSGINNE